MLNPRINNLSTFLLVPSVLTSGTVYSRSSKSDNDKTKPKPAWAKKDIRDFDDADLERLYEQWEEDDEPLPEDELPEYKRAPPPVPSFDFSKMASGGSLNPDDIMKLSKKGKTVMMFVNMEGNPTKDQCETWTSIWQTALRNNHIQAERYVIDDGRAILLFSDGSQAWEAKDFLVTQEHVKDVTLEGQVHEGKFKAKETETKPKKKEKAEL